MQPLITLITYLSAFVVREKLMQENLFKDIFKILG